MLCTENLKLCFKYVSLTQLTQFKVILGFIDATI